MLLEGDPDSDAALRALLVTDAVANPVYNVDFAKFQQTILGGGSGGGVGGAAVAQGTPVTSGAGYY